VILGGRTLRKAQAAADALPHELPTNLGNANNLGFANFLDAPGRVSPVECALGSVAEAAVCAAAVQSVLAATQGTGTTARGGHAYGHQGEALDGLVLNAGIAYSPDFATSADGFEQTMGTKFVSQFHLTQLLLPRLLWKQAGAGDGGGGSAPVGTCNVGRVVVLSSLIANLGSVAALTDDDRLGMNWTTGASMKFQRVRSTGTWRPWLGGTMAYADSKLAAALFARELHRT